MRSPVIFALEEGLALSAAAEAVRRVSEDTPVLTRALRRSPFDSECRVVASFRDGSTAEVFLRSWRGWVRLFPPKWAADREFRQAELVVDNSRGYGSGVEIGTLHRVPLAEIKPQELPEHLRIDDPRGYLRFGPGGS